MLPDQLSRTKLHGNDVTEALRFLTSSCVVPLPRHVERSNLTQTSRPVRGH